MNCPECIALLHDYVDDELDVADTRAVESHLAACSRCRAEHAALRRLLAGAAALPKEIPPQRDLWSAIEFEATRLEHQSPLVASSEDSVGPVRGFRPAAGLLRWFAPIAIAASIVFLAMFAERSLPILSDQPAWSIDVMAGAPRVNARPIQGEAKFRVGQWLETDAVSRASVAVGRIGDVTVDPNSRLRLVNMAASDHRLELKRGSIRASIMAPPRLFFVNTPSATAIDYGCEYTLNVDDFGNGELHVTIGYVALEYGSRESIIPMGMKCLTRRGAGPGTPFAEDAPSELRAALVRFDFERGAAALVLPEILARARTEDVVTLWHLLGRTGGTQRGEVFDALAKFSTVPAGVTRAGILAGDPVMLRTWADALGLRAFGPL